MLLFSIDYMSMNNNYNEQVLFKCWPSKSNDACIFYTALWHVVPVAPSESHHLHCMFTSISIQFTTSKFSWRFAYTKDCVYCWENIRDYLHCFTWSTWLVSLRVVGFPRRLTLTLVASTDVHKTAPRDEYAPCWAVLRTFAGVIKQMSTL